MGMHVPARILATPESLPRLLPRRGAPRKTRIAPDSLAGLRFLLRRLRFSFRDVAKTWGRSPSWVSRVFRGVRGVDGGTEALLQGLLLVYGESFHKRYGQHLRPPAARDLVDGKSVSHPLIDRLDHLTMIGPDRLKLSGYLTCPTLPSVVRSSARLHWATFHGRVDRDQLSKMTARWRAHGYGIRRNSNWLLSVGGQGPFYFAAIPAESNTVRNRYNAMLQIKGAAFDADPSGSVAHDIFWSFLGPWLEPGSLSVTRVDVALDLELPFAGMLPFRRNWFPSCPRKGFDKAGRPLKWGSSWHNTGADVCFYHSLGPQRARYVCYDKAAEAENSELSIMDADSKVRHAKGWDHLLRNEFRFAPSCLRPKLGTNPRLFSEMPNVFERFGVVDLMTVDPASPWLPIFLLAKISSVERVSLRMTKEERSAFRRALLVAERQPGLSEVFEEHRRQLQATFDTIIRPKTR